MRDATNKDFASHFILLNFGQLNVHYYRSVLQVEVNILPEEGLGNVQVETIHLPSPFQVFLGYFAPATLANGELITFEDYVNFYVFVFAFFIPWVFTTLHKPSTFNVRLVFSPFPFKLCCEKYPSVRGER